MICPKCKSEKQFGNFCSECGNRLKEKCPECGKMEPIGRKVCETKLEEIEQVRKEYLKSKIGDWRKDLLLIFAFFVAVGMMSLLGFVLGYVIRNGSPSLPCLGILVCGIFVAITLATINNRLQNAEQKAKRKFLQEHSDYAEILCKAKE